MKMTRRKLAVALAAPALVSTGRTAEQAQGPAAADPVAAAKARLQANAQTLAREHVPTAVEPAFQFRA